MVININIQKDVVMVNIIMNVKEDFNKIMIDDLKDFVTISTYQLLVIIVDN